MGRNIYSYLGVIILTLFLNNSFAQKGLKKHIDITVLDASTGRPLDGAVVILKGLFKETRTTNIEGKASFDIVVLSNNLTLSLEVSDGEIISGHSKYKGNFQITGDRDNYSRVVSLKSSYNRINVSVIDDKQRRGVADAKVTLGGSRDGKNDVNSTDGNGNVSFDVLLIDNYKTVTVTIVKDGFEAFTTTVDMNYKISQYTVNAILITDKYSKTIKVSVMDEKGDPVPEATLAAEGPGFNDFARGSTDQSGVVSLLVKSSGEYIVSLKHDNFEQAADQKVTVNRLGDINEYTLSFQLKRKKGKLRNLTVRVFDEKDHTPVPKASVDVRSVTSTLSGGITNDMGLANLSNVLALGEDGKVTVNANGYEPATNSYIGGGDNYRYSPPLEDDLTIYLKKRDDGDIKFTVLALDKNTDQPISNASILISDNASANITPIDATNSKGEVQFDISGKYLNNTPFRVKARANGYMEQWSDVTADFLKGGNERDKIFTVYLQPETSSNLSGTWVDVRVPSSTINISVSGTSAHGSGANVKPDLNHNTSFTDVDNFEGTIKSNIITGSWTNTYEDFDKVVKYGGTITISLDSKDQVNIEYAQKGPATSVVWKVKGTYEFYWCHDGATWFATYKRK